MRTEALLGRLTATAGAPWRRRAFDSRPFRAFRQRVEGVVRAVDGPGTYIYDHDWDLLVVVDACRFDLFREATTDVEFVENSAVESVRSPASMTRYWMRENFDERFESERSDTAYVAGNPISGQELEDEQFAVLEEPWRYAWDTDPPATLPARPVTDRAVTVGRSDRELDRLLVHYLQPHCPFVTRPEFTRGKRPDSFTEQSWDDVWMRLEKGELSPDEVWAGYRENLEYVLEEVGLLLENVDAERAIITSDHGNAAGEWNLYGHPPHREFDCLRRVPWVEVTATDTGTHTPEEWTDAEGPNVSIQDRLSALGYTG